MFTHDLGIGGLTVIAAPDNLLPEQHDHHDTRYGGHQFADDDGPALALEQQILMDGVQLQHPGIGCRHVLLVLFFQEPGHFHGRHLLAAGTPGRDAAGFSAGISLERRCFLCSSL